MSSGERRRSERICELDARRAQHAKSPNKGKGTCELAVEQDLDTGQDQSNQKWGRKQIMIRPVQDLVVNTIEYQVQKAGALGKEDHANAAVMSSRTAILEKSKLELLLSILQRRDSHRIFAEPVNGKEVEGYYDVIKEPMDFGTISTKLNGGSYETLEEFEHDVFLVSSNAMLFNASTTLYYRQARAIKELAKKLFHALKTDPENFESEFSKIRLGPGRRTKAEARILNSNSCNKTTGNVVTSTGCRDERSDCLEVGKRGTYRPWTAFLNENVFIVSSVFNSPKPLLHINQGNIGYEESLMRFVKDLGQTPQMVARRKVQRSSAEALNIEYTTSNHQLLAPKYHIPAAASTQKANIIFPSLNFLGRPAGPETFSGDNMHIQYGTLNREQASTVNSINSMNLSGTSSRGLPCASSTMENLGDLQGNVVQFKSMSEGLDIGTPFKKDMADQSFGIYLGCSLPIATSGEENLIYSAAWCRNNLPDKRNFSNMMENTINMDNDQMAMAASSESMMQEILPTRNDVASSFSWQWPSEAVTGTQAVGFMGGLESNSVGRGMHHYQAMADSDRGDPIYRNSEISNWFRPMELGLQPISGCSFKELSKSAEVNILGEAGPSQQQDWEATTLDGQVLKTWNTHGRCETHSQQGEFKFEALPDNQQQQSSLGWAPLRL